jgi:hypothetical protein
VDPLTSLTGAPKMPGTSKAKKVEPRLSTQMTTLLTVVYVLVRTPQSNTTLVAGIVITLDSVKVILTVVHAVPIMAIQQSIINAERRKLILYLKMDRKNKVWINLNNLQLLRNLPTAL